jgi:branched-chain amino acid transport system ATP-binding protein
VLRVDNVAAGYGAVQILWDVSLQVEAGEIVSIVGRNGVGKSTLLKAIVGLADVMKGEILLKSDSIRKLGTAAVARAGVGYVAQSQEVCSHLTVQENLQVALFAARRSLDSIVTLYERFPRLKERSRQQAGTLSGGERKLLAFARITLLKPMVYLVDEPTEGLMPSAVDEIRSLLSDLRNSGAAIVLVEQNLDLVRQLASRVYLLDVGRIEKCVAELDHETAERYLGV